MLIGGDDISNDVITLGICFSMFVYIRARFRFALIGGNLTAQSTGSHRGIGVPETLLQGFLPFPSPPPECLGELAHRLPMVVDTEPHPHHNTKTNRINWGLWLTDHLPLP